MVEEGFLRNDDLVAVQKKGMIGFVDHKGNTVIGFRFPYHGNPTDANLQNISGEIHPFPAIVRNRQIMYESD